MSKFDLFLFSQQRMRVEIHLNSVLYCNYIFPPHIHKEYLMSPMTVTVLLSALFFFPSKGIFSSSN